MPVLRLLLPLCRLKAVAAWGVLLLVTWAQGAFAQQWDNMAVISSTLGNTAGRVCVGAGVGDIGCKSNAPYVDAATGYFGLATNAPSSTLHIGSTLLSSTITLHPFINTGAAAAYKTSIYSQYMSGNAFGILVNGFTLISTTSDVYSQVQYGTTSTVRHWFAGGRVAIGGPNLNGIAPSTTLDVNGTLKIANGGEACDANRVGAIRYTSGEFSFCRNGSTWESLSSIVQGTADRITSGTTSLVVISTTGYISLTQAGSNTGWFDPTRGLVTLGISSTGPISGTYGYFNGRLTVTGNSTQAAISATNISATTNISAARLIATNISATGNASAALMIATNASVTTNLSAARLIASNISATTNISAARLIATNISATGNASAALMIATNASITTNLSAVRLIATNISATTNISAVRFIGDGSLLTGVVASATDRITSGTTSLVAISTTGYISLTQAGSNTGWFDPTRGLVTLGVSSTGTVSGTGGYFSGNVAIGVSSSIYKLALGGSSASYAHIASSGSDAALILSGGGTGNFIVGNQTNGSSGVSNFSIYSYGVARDVLTILRNSGALGINTTNPSTTMHVSGTIRLADGGEACDANRAGAIRYTSSEFSFCRNGTAWESLNSIVQGSADRITSGTTSLVVISNTGYISLTQAGSNTGWFDPTRGLVTLGISSTGTISGTRGYFSGNVGIGNPNPNMKLDVSSGSSSVDSIVRISVPSLATADPILEFFGEGAYGFRVGLDISDSGKLKFDAGNGPIGGDTRMTITYGGGVGIRNSNPSTSLHVSGTLRLANGGEACDADRVGAIRYTSSEFSFCRNGTAWETLSSIVQGTADRITSGTTSLVVISNTGYISLTQAGSNTGWFDPTRGLVTLGVSSTGTVSGTGGYFSGNVGVGALPNSTYPLDVSGSGISINGSTPRLFFRNNLAIFGRVLGTVDGLAFQDTSAINRLRLYNNGAILNGPLNVRPSSDVGLNFYVTEAGQVGISMTAGNPSTVLHVSGTLRLANGGEACDANRVGAIRYTSSEFSFCRNGTAWESLSSIVQGTADRITSGTTSLVAISTTGYISLTQAGSNTGWFDPTRGLVTLGVSSTGTISGTAGYFSGNVGVGETNPGYPFVVSKNTYTSTTAGSNILARLQSNATGADATLQFSDGVTYANTISMKLGNLILAPDFGNVGIGTQNPSQSLHVVGGDVLIENNQRIKSKLANGTEITLLRYGTDNRTYVGANQEIMLAGGVFLQPIGSAVISLTTGTNLNVTYAGGSFIYTSGTQIGMGGVAAPSTALHLAGTLRLANGGEACDANRAGAIKYASSVFSFCNGTAWQTLAEAAGGTTSIDSLTDGEKNLTTANMFLGTSYTTALVNHQYNVGIGQYALDDLNDDNTQVYYGDANTAVGHAALTANTTGYSNAAFGYLALTANTTGSDNTALGRASLLNNTIGSANTAVGSGALYFNTAGTSNSAYGLYAMHHNTIGFSNVASGYEALFNNQGGSYNTALGTQAGKGSATYSVTGTTVVGYYAGAALETGANYNTLLGYAAGANITTGSSNIIIGTGLSAPVATGSNQLNIGNIIFGNTSTGRVGINFVTPSVALEVGGTVSATAVRLDTANGAGCDGTIYNTLKVEGGRLYLCRE